MLSLTEFSRFVATIALLLFCFNEKVFSDETVNDRLIEYADADSKQKETTTNEAEVNENPKIVSVYGSLNLSEYRIPFDDEYPTGPFERLDKNVFLFISKCGDIYFTRLEMN